MSLPLYREIQIFIDLYLGMVYACHQWANWTINFGSQLYVL